MATNYYWLKLHYDILDDWKVGTLQDSLKWLFIQCLCVAGEYNDAGFLPELNQFAYRIRREPGALNADMARLATNELVELKLDENNQERWYITKYEKRQAKKESAERQRDYRTRQRDKETTESNDSVTDKSRQRYDSVTTRNTDKIRVDKIRVDVEDERAPLYDGHAENEKPQETMAAIAAVVKETLTAGFNEQRFADAAHAIKALKAEDRIAGFADWWKRNSYYDDNGKPALKSFLGEFQNYLDGVERKKKDGKQSDGFKTQEEGYHIAGGI